MDELYTPPPHPHSHQSWDIVKVTDETAAQFGRVGSVRSAGAYDVAGVAHVDVQLDGDDAPTTFAADQVTVL